jgi:hypothetical protein
MGKASDYLAKRATTPGAKLPPTPAARDDAMKRIWENIRKHELEHYITELETFGLTVIPPEKASPPGFIKRLKEATLQFIEKHDGRAPDLETGLSHKNQILGDYHYLILHDPVFQEMLCQPVATALLDYTLGESSIVHANSALCKGSAGAVPLIRGVREPYMGADRLFEGQRLTGVGAGQSLDVPSSAAGRRRCVGDPG